MSRWTAYAIGVVVGVVAGFAAALFITPDQYAILTQPFRDVALESKP